MQAAEYVPVAGDFAQLEQADIATDTNYASQGYWKGVATHFVRNKRAMIGLILVLLMIFLAFVAPLFSGYAYDEIVTALNAKGRKKAAVGISPRVPAIHEMVTGEPYDDIYADKTFLFGTNAGVVHAIRGINLDLQKGETVAIVGESGSGKSVTMKAAVGLLDSNATINSGEILYTYDDGHGQDKTLDLLKLSKKQLRTEYNGQRLAMVFQDPMTSLDPTMTIGKQIMEGMLLHKHMPKDEARTKALQLLELVGITDAEKRFRNYPHQLSGGMRQRVVIAIALSAEPDILICDEPTTALDVTIQSKILDLIKQIQQKMHLSVIYITHDLGVVAKVADYVNVMYAGKIVEVGNVEEIFYEPRHPYTWGLLSAMPDLETANDRLYSIPGSPPNLLHEPVGDAFAARNRFANWQEREEKISEMLKKVGLSPEHAARYPHQFSGGQRQRVGIARALIMNPKLIIADECISALDVSIQAQVVNLMKDIQEETQCAYLFIAHDLSMVKYISDRIGVLHLGYMVESGTKEEIFSHPIHLYTKSLLSAIPHPNPVVEKHRVALTYNYATSGIDYTKGTEHSVGGTHTVLATDEEFDSWTK